MPSLSLLTGVFSVDATREDRYERLESQVAQLRQEIGKLSTGASQIIGTTGDGGLNCGIGYVLPAETTENAGIIAVLENS